MMKSIQFSVNLVFLATICIVFSTSAKRGKKILSDDLVLGDAFSCPSNTVDDFSSQECRQLAAENDLRFVEISNPSSEFPSGCFESVESNTVSFNSYVASASIVTASTSAPSDRAHPDGDAAWKRANATDNAVSPVSTVSTGNLSSKSSASTSISATTNRKFCRKKPINKSKHCVASHNARSTCCGASENFDGDFDRIKNAQNSVISENILKAGLMCGADAPICIGFMKSSEERSRGLDSIIDDMVLEFQNGQMKSEVINAPESARTYSSKEEITENTPTDSTLDSPTAWTASPTDENPWMIIELDRELLINGLAIQANGADPAQRVTQVAVELLDDTGEVIGNELLSPELGYPVDTPNAKLSWNFETASQGKKPMTARKVKVLVKKFEGKASMRVGIIAGDINSIPNEVYERYVPDFAGQCIRAEQCPDGTFYNFDKNRGPECAPCGHESESDFLNEYSVLRTLAGDAEALFVSGSDSGLYNCNSANGKNTTAMDTAGQNLADKCTARPRFDSAAALGGLNRLCDLDYDGVSSKTDKPATMFNNLKCELGKTFHFFLKVWSK